MCSHPAHRLHRDGGASVKRLLTALRAMQEAVARPGILSMAGWKLVVGFRADVSMYFKQMAAAIDLTHAGENDYGLIEPHLLSVIRQAQPQLLNSYLRHAKAAYLLSGKKPVYTGGQIYASGEVKEADDRAVFAVSRSASPLQRAKEEELYAKLDRLGLTGQQAIDYITEHGAELVKGIDDYTIKILREIIAEGIESQLGVQGTVKRIREEFGSMSTSRARSIATTEMNDAMSEAALDKIVSVGLDGKRWIRSTGACPLCDGNAKQGIIPVGQAFQSGHQRPPGHPGKCRCAVAGARLPKAA